MRGKTCGGWLLWYKYKKHCSVVTTIYTKFILYFFNLVTLFINQYYPRLPSISCSDNTTSDLCKHNFISTIYRRTILWRDQSRHRQVLFRCGGHAARSRTRLRGDAHLLGEPGHPALRAQEPHERWGEGAAPHTGTRKG